MERDRLVGEIFNVTRLRSFASRDDLLADVSRAYEERGVESELGEVEAMADAVEAWNSHYRPRRWISEAAKRLGRRRRTT